MLLADRFNRVMLAGREITSALNEPAIFQTPTKTMPPGTLHRIDSDDFAARTTTHAEAHNVYGLLMARATHEGLRSLRPNERPFVLICELSEGRKRTYETRMHIALTRASVTKPVGMRIRPGGPAGVPSGRPF